MKATRAYIASLGTTGVLLAASILLLTIVSALVAFDGWPRGTVTSRVDRLTISESALQIPVSATAAAGTRAATRPGGARGAGRTAGPAPGSRGVAGERIASPLIPPAVGVRGVLPGTGLPNPLRGAGPEIPALPAVPGATGLKDQVAAGAEQLTGSAGTSVGEASPQVGEALTSAGRTAGQAIRAVPLTG